MSTPTPNIHPLVRLGNSAHFQLANRNWHRTESYPSPCLCGYPPSQAVSVKPGIDDSWRYSPDDTWGPCISKLADRGADHPHRDYVAMQDGSSHVFEVGQRVRIKDVAATQYELGKSDHWVIEALGFKQDDGTVRVARIRADHGLWVRVPLTWIEPWTEQTKEEPMVDMRTLADPMTIKFKLTPTDDAEITCIVCQRQECTHEFTSRAAGQRTSLGIHGACAKGIIGVEVS
jgi:hypothetical protein